MKELVNISSLQLTAGKDGRVLLQNFTGNIRTGELIALTGLNGAGKSTLLFSLSGITQPVKGTITILGKNLGTSTIQEKSRLCSIVFTAQENVPWMDVYSFVASGRAPYTPLTGTLSNEDHAIISRVLEQTGLSSFSDRFLQTLSDGEKQRCLIARALVQDTPFILLDEPTAFLDVKNKKQVMELLRELSEKNQKAILFSTHDIQLAKKFAHSVWWIHEQQIQVVTPESFSEEVFH